MPLVASRANASAGAFGFSAASASEELGGMVLITPTSIASTGTGNSSSINANGSVTFSSCITLSLNGVFTSEYDNYMIVMRHVSSSGDPTIFMKLRSAGTDTSDSTYYVQRLEVSNTTLTATRYELISRFYAANSSATQRSGDVIRIYGPYLSQPTVMRTNSAWGRNNAQIEDRGGSHVTSSSYDGFTLGNESTETFSGLVSVYGLVGA